MKKPYNVRKSAIQRGYRSGLEDNIAKQLKRLNTGAEYEPFKIPYYIPKSDHTYTPDFVLPNGIVIESKGRFTLEDRKKHILLQQQWPDLELRFVFSSSKSKLRKGSKTTLANWCDRNGFLYADKLVPEAWVSERHNRKSLKVIEKWKQQ